jgi:hypothetical protein
MLSFTFMPQSLLFTESTLFLSVIVPAHVVRVMGGGDFPLSLHLSHFLPDTMPGDGHLIVNDSSVHLHFALADWDCGLLLKMCLCVFRRWSDRVR